MTSEELAKLNRSLGRIEERLNSVDGKVDALKVDTCKKVYHQADRLGAVERRTSWLTGWVSIITVAVGSVITGVTGWFTL